MDWLEATYELVQRIYRTKLSGVLSLDQYRKHPSQRNLHSFLLGDLSELSTSEYDRAFRSTQSRVFRVSAADD
jgi:hypothetical protein